LIVLGAGVIGAIGAARRPDLFKAAGHAGGAGQAGLIDRIIDGGGAAHTKPRRGHVWRTLLLWLPLCLAPMAVLVPLLGPDHVFSKISLFFSQMAVVTFGGAYAVLAYVAQEAVQGYGWLQPGEMLDGLALAETTPGPLILVLQFVGFLAGYRDPGPFTAMTGGILGGLLASWVTFTPSFVWIFLGAPYIERLRHNRRLSSALASITAAVVGVVLNLAVWFALHVLFLESATEWLGPLRLIVPEPSSLDLTAFALTIAAMIAMLAMRIGLIPVLAGCAAAGLATRLF
jgi:chromate transporter